MTTASKYCILAEEIGHHFTTSGNILDQTPLDNQRQELRARKWAYEKIIPLEAVLSAIADGFRETWEIADYLEVEENFLKDALKPVSYTHLDVYKRQSSSCSNSGITSMVGTSSGWENARRFSSYTSLMFWALLVKEMM